RLVEAHRIPIDYWYARSELAITVVAPRTGQRRENNLVERVQCEHYLKPIHGPAGFPNHPERRIVFFPQMTEVPTHVIEPPTDQETDRGVHGLHERSQDLIHFDLA